MSSASTPTAACPPSSAAPSRPTRSCACRSRRNSSSTGRAEIARRPSGAARRALAALAAAAVLAPATAAATSYLGRPIYSEPASGLQLPPDCHVEPTWRESIAGVDFEVWIAECEGVARVWLLKRQVIEVVSAHEARLRFQVLDERVLPDEKAGDTLSVQCTGAETLPAVVVRGARWRNTGRELRLEGAAGAMRVDLAQRRLVDILNFAGAIDCTRFPDREAMMRKLQQSEHPNK